MVGMDRKKENSSAAERDIPEICPAAIVDMEREVPGNTAENIWQNPTQMACARETPSIRSVRYRPFAGGWPKRASTSHMMIPPINSEHPITHKLSRLAPILLRSSHAGPAVTTKATSTSIRGWLKRVRSAVSPRGNLRNKPAIRERK